MQERFGYGNVNEIPKLEKVVVNMSVGEALVNPKALDDAVAELTAITGQKPVIAKAKKSIAAFKLRAGINIGAKVTLRGDRMYVFLDKLFNIVLPRIRDFRGLPAKSFDGRGNYNLGLREQLVFPEINYDKVDKTRGMDITIVTRRRPTKKRRSSWSPWGCRCKRSAREVKRVGKNESDREVAAHAEVFGAQAQPLPALRAAAGLSAPLRHVPHLLPRERARRHRAGRDQGVVVGAGGIAWQ